MTVMMEGPDYSDLEAQFAVSEDFGCDSVIVVSGLPLVTAAKEEKLSAVIAKIFKNVGKVAPGGVFMPKDASGQSKGFAFVEFETAEMAAAAVKLGDGYRLDKSHVLAVNFFNDIEKYAGMDETFVPPKVDKYQPKEHLKSWLSDDKARDQFVLLRGENTGIYFNNRGDKPDKDHARDNWTDSHVAFSPKGLFLATVHKQGIALWGGKSWAKIMRFPHPNAKFFDFSPGEKYVVTWSLEPFATKDGDKQNLCAWDIVSGQLLRSFYVETGAKASKTGGITNIDWPIFKWSHDDKYLAKMTPGPDGMIQVYETPGMGLLDKKSIKVENVMDMAWSPKDHVLSYWTPEQGNIPARVTLMNIPSREILRTKNLFGVLDCKIYWQSSGDYIVVKIDRAKSKKHIVTTFELYRLREKDVPVDVLEANPEEEIGQIFWEPYGSRFVVLGQEGQKQVAHFYEVLDPTKTGAVPVTNADMLGNINLVRSVETKGVNTVSWSPRGRFCILAGIRSHTGTLQFWDTQENVLLASEEHYACTNIEWDPTGRYVATCVSSWHVQTDTGFMMWTFTGSVITREIIHGFKQFLWRPRPPTLLSDKDLKKIRKNLKEYSRDFDVEDMAEKNKASREVVEKRKEQMEEWKILAERWAEEYESQREERIALYGFDPQEALAETDEWVPLPVLASAK